MSKYERWFIGVVLSVLLLLLVGETSGYVFMAINSVVNSPQVIEACGETGRK